MAALGSVMDAVGCSGVCKKQPNWAGWSCSPQMAPGGVIEGSSLGWREHTNMCLPGRAELISSPWWMFRLLFPSVLHPWLLPALTELETPSPPRHKLPALLCWALGTDTVSPLILHDGKSPLGLAVQDQKLNMCSVEIQGMAVRRATATAQIQTNCLLPCKVDLCTPNTQGTNQTWLGILRCACMEVVPALRKPP